MARQARDHGRDAAAAAPRLLLDGEAATLAMMLQHVTRRKPERTALVARTVAVGNISYLNDRHVLVEWMIDVCNVFGFVPTTLHTAVRHVDWFMSKRKIPQTVWQLCAVACVFIAAKCEEQAEVVPLLSELQQVCGNAYDAEVVKRMEVLVLEVLEWDPIDRGAIHFLFFNLRTVQRLVESPVVVTPPRSPKRSRAEADLDLDLPSAKVLKTQSSADTIDENRSTVGAKDDATATFLECRSPVSEVWGDEEAPSHVEPAPIDYLESHLSGDVLAYGRTAAAVLDQVLYDPALCATQNPQRIAAAALYVARKSASALPAWPVEYQAATGLAEHEFSEQAALLTHVFDSAARGEASRDPRYDANEKL